MSIETLDDWNERIAAGCGCCEMPSCPVPTRECESITGIAGCPLAPDPGEEPAENESITYGCFIPFEAAALDAEDDLAVYTMLRESTSENHIEGTYKSFFSDIDVEGDDARRSELTTITYPASPDTDNISTQGWFQTSFEDPTGIWQITEYDDSGTATEAPPGVTEWEEEDDVCEMTATSLIKKTGVESAESGSVSGFRTTTNLVQTTDPATQTSIFEYAWELEKAALKTEATLSVPYTKAEMVAEAEANLPTEFPELPTDTDCASSKIITWPKKKDFSWPTCADAESRNASLGAAITKARFRWVIPDTWAGSHFKITWDVVFFPEDESAPTVIATDQTWTWIGPGDPEDADTWKSEWHEVPVPTAPGETRVVNIRFECYQGPYGNKPQITGEAYDIPT
jgi:hypothetical protein